MIWSYGSFASELTKCLC